MGPHKKNFYCWIVLLLLSSLPYPASAAPLSREAVPEPLVPWIDWVLHDHESLSCPIIQGAATCLWPGNLRLQLDASGGRFQMALYTDRDMPVPLPGSGDRWPEEVMLDGRPVAVYENAETPTVAIPSGGHLVAGRFVWQELPEGISVPPIVARVALEVNGKPVPAPKRDETGKLWLTGATQADESDALDLSVMRRIEDGIPIMVETRIVVRVSGKAREVMLSNVLLDGTIPLSVTSPIPARLDNEGSMSLQVRPGTHEISVTARTQHSLEKFTLGEHPQPWPEQEVWVWQANERLRQVTLSGLSAVDPSRTDLSESWRHLPAYLAAPGDVLTLDTTRRGEPSPPPDQVSLERKMWLDLDGSGFTIQDRLTGELNQTSRIDLSPPNKLARATVNGQDVLITKGAGGQSGVEIRQHPLNLVAEWRSSAPPREIPAVGWTRDVQSLGTTLYLPPGWRLLFAKGVDAISNTWWDEWNLFSFFFVLIVSIAIGKLTRWYFGLISLVALVLSQHEVGAPFEVWVGLLIPLALLKVVPKGKLRIAVQVAWWLSVVWLAGVLVPFSVRQMRTGLFPQVANVSSFSYNAYSGFAFEASPPPAASPTTTTSMVQADEGEMDDKPAKERRKYKGRGDDSIRDVQSITQSLSEISKDDFANIAQNQQVIKQKRFIKLAQMTQDPKAVVQTGIGVPSWSWQQWQLNWTGPVVKNHTIALYVISPKINLALSIARVLLLLLIGLRLVSEGRRIATGSNGDRRDVEKPAAATLAMLLLFSLPSSAFAGGALTQTESMISADLLNRLETRLTAPAECVPNCVVLPHLDMSVAGDQMEMRLTVHAAEKSGVPIPGPARNWVPSLVTIDGRETDAVATLDNGYLYVRLEPGVHNVVLKGAMPRNGALTLAFYLPPKRITAKAENWTVDGLRADGRVDGAIQLTKNVEVTKDSQDEIYDDGAYPPWLEVERELMIGIPWTINTTVRRISPPGTPILEEIPLLPGESVTASDLEVKNSAVKVSLGRDDTVLTWTSTLKEQEKITLASPKGEPWSEVWQVRCSPVWRCSFEGISPISRKTDNQLAPLFRPWPGESIQVTTEKPDGMPGVSVTIDSAELTLSPGKRLLKAVLKLNIRTSRGGEQVLRLPKQAVVQSVTVDGSDHPYRQSDEKIYLTLKTGSQVVQIDWQEPTGMSIRYQTGEIALGRQAANVKISIKMPRDRWLIYVGGPRWGPAILFWGYLLTILLGGLVLGRIELSRLRSWQWMILGLGLTQVPVEVMLIIVSWFFIVSWREKYPISQYVFHNILQVFIAVWTLVSLGCLVWAVYDGLAVRPDMQVSGFGSSNQSLNWYIDRISDTLPTPWVVSVPILVWKIIMLGWALWLAASIVRWAPWAWRAYTHAGFWLFRQQTAPVVDAPPAPETHQAPPPVRPPSIKPPPIEKKTDPKP